MSARPTPHASSHRGVVSRRAPEIEVSLEEAALFDTPAPHERRGLESVPPPRTRCSTLPPPRFDEEATAKRAVPESLLRALQRELDSVRAMRAARAFEDEPPPSSVGVDLSKTLDEGPAIAPESSGAILVGDTSRIERA